MRFLLSSSSGKVALSCPYFMKLALKFPNKLISFLHVSQGAYDTVKLDNSFLTQFITKISRDIIKRMLPIKIKVLQKF